MKEKFYAINHTTPYNVTLILFIAAPRNESFLGAVFYIFTYMT